MKKFFTLLALLTCFLGANAKEVVDLEIDNNFTQLGWASDPALERVSVQGGIVSFHSEAATENLWDVQFQLPGVPSLDNDALYTITLKIKGTVAQNIHGGFSGSNNVDIPVTTDWQTVVLEGCQNNPTAQYFANSGCLLIQCGDYVGDWQISYMKITHEERDDQRPKEWIELLENGDAEKPWGDLASIRWNDQENNYKICAWGKEKGVNMNENDGWDPFPATIEDDGTGNHVFVVHGKVADTEGNASSWDNQFWIEAPRQLKPGELLKIHFRYKASETANTNTQIHHQNPSDYQFYQCIGDINFTTEWQEYDKEVSWPGGGDLENAWSICFNLNAQNKGAVDFYFDDLSIQELKLDHGWFIASSNADNGIAYNYDNAIEFEVLDDSNADDVLLTATVGTAGKPETWIKEVMISTVRGHDGTFKSSTIVPTSTNIKPYNLDTGEGDWYDYTSKSSAKIALPAAGVWQIILATGTKQMAFVQIEGDAVVEKEPVAIVTNTTENVVKGQEREPTATEQPADEEAGIAAGTGQPWDNQFFIVANREIKTGESVTLKFKYKSSIDAKTTTQLHGDPGAYIYWNAIGEVNFTTEWQNFEKTWEIPYGDNNTEITFKSIAFNMAEIKEACNYEIKDVQWYLKDDALEAEGKTLENFINAEGDANFYVKEGAGTAPYIVSGISSVVKESKASNNAIYNLAGQRVSKNYKGIVIKNGVKYIAK